LNPACGKMARLRERLGERDVVRLEARKLVRVALARFLLTSASRP
jgi:hypothetical protein